jgi:predicted transcriptional regulator
MAASGYLGRMAVSGRKQTEEKWKFDRLGWAGLVIWAIHRPGPVFFHWSLFGVLLGQAMELHFSAEKEARIHQFANRTGKDTAQVVEEAIDRMLEYDARFLEAVEEGRAAARRGELLEHDEVVERIEQMFRS